MPPSAGALVVVALGGNAIQAPGDDDSVAADFERTTRTARHIGALVEKGYRLVVTHGNGPQVGNHLLRSELGNRHGNLPLLPLDVCVADTEGGMGYMLQQCVGNEMSRRAIPAVVVAIVTQTLVDAGDPAFGAPSKPVGELILEDRVDEVRRQGWPLVEDGKRRGWRRVVSSPDPKEIVEAGAIEAMVAHGVMVVAVGGGGIPVVQRPDGALEGVAAVVDKDLASALLASDLDADALLILTDVDRAYLDYGSSSPRPIDGMNVAEARGYLDRGEFGEGSMRPKVQAACRFVTSTGKEAVIASIAGAEDALMGRGGTRITA